MWAYPDFHEDGAQVCHAAAGVAGYAAGCRQWQREGTAVGVDKLCRQQIAHSRAAATFDSAHGADRQWIHGEESPVASSHADGCGVATERAARTQCDGRAIWKDTATNAA